ncbi:MAG: 6,7-dimethyl-8-ribityllumazine synthase [Candidatus Amulumruptor caecigallinarius]|nr:6,7-dimethyl-8-ribityllumazine synthase [Candidatus Amulumruptor caecigallinarius]
MSTILNTNGSELTVPEINEPSLFKVAIFTAEWNPEITDALRKGAVETLRKAGIDDKSIFLQDVPGTVELVNAAAMAVNFMPDVKAVIVLGCVIRGDTPHFDYVCDIVSQGVSALNSQGKTPVIFGVLTVDSEEQALDRAGGKLGNKGAEAAVAAIKMANMHTLAAGLRYTAFRK